MALALAGVLALQRTILTLQDHGALLRAFGGHAVSVTLISHPIVPSHDTPCIVRMGSASLYTRRRMSRLTEAHLPVRADVTSQDYFGRMEWLGLAWQL